MTNSTSSISKASSSRAKSSKRNVTAARANRSSSSVATRSATLRPARSRNSVQATSQSSSPSMPNELCPFCRKPGVVLRHVTRSYGRATTLLVIENIPMFSCPHCGESYFTAETLHEVERIKAHRRSLAPPRQVPVAVFA